MTDFDNHAPLATFDDAIREWAVNVNAPAEQEWILSDYDTWERNPRYRGKPGPHPEDYPVDYEEFVDQHDRKVARDEVFDDIPDIEF